MNSDEIPIEDIVLLQLFKDNLVSSSLEERKGKTWVWPDVTVVCPGSDCSPLSTDDSELSDLDSVLSQDRHHQSTAWPDLDCQEYAGYSAMETRAIKQEMVGDLVTSAKRMGKDEKLAKEANIPFTVKVSGS